MTEPQPLAQRLYCALADGEFHSGTQLAAQFGVSRSAVWKSLGALEGLGMVVHAVPNRGYRLPLATPPLDAQQITALLPIEVAARLRRGEALWSLDSTNAQLLRRADLPAGHFDFLAAEYQSAGRGRRTRHWFAPPGAAICLSVGWSFRVLPAAAGSLSLAIGVCALRALAAAGIAGIALKWPNDLVTAAGKLGGILIELRAEAAGPAYVVVGIGLNVALGTAIAEHVQATGTHAVDLASLGVVRCDRNRLTALIIAEIVAGLLHFEKRGFEPFIADWGRADALAGKAVLISSDAGNIAGHARGIDVDGALCVQTLNGLRRFVSGEVSVRTEA